MAQYLDHDVFLKGVYAYHKAVSGTLAEPDTSYALKKVVYCTQKLGMVTLLVEPIQSSHIQNWMLEMVEVAGELPRCFEFELEIGKSGAVIMNEKLEVLVKRSKTKEQQMKQNKFLSMCHTGPMQSSMAVESRKIGPN